MIHLSRRALLVAAAAGGAGTVTAAILATDRPRAPQSPLPTSPTTTPPPRPAAPTPLPRGGAVALATDASFDVDTFDPQRSGEPSTVELLGRVHARLLQWADPHDARLGPDLAAAWEQPTPDLLLLHLDPTAHWHASPPLDGSGVTADQVAAHLDRAVAIARETSAPLAQRSAPLRDIAGVESIDARTLRIRLASPSPFLPAALAGEYALVLHPAVADTLDAAADPRSPTHLVGSGPWLLQSFDVTARFRAHPGSHRPPLLEALAVSQPVDVLDRYRTGELDEFPAFDPRTAAEARTLPGIQEVHVHQREIILSTFATDAPPWSDARLLQAISGALSRAWLAEALLAGRADPCGPLPPVYGAALPADALAEIPGYGPDAATEARDARQRWEAAGGPALGPVVVEFPAIFEPRYAASAVILSRLEAVLGTPFRPSITSYTAIARRVQERSYGNGRAEFWFGWGAPLPSPDPREALLELYGHALTPAERGTSIAPIPVAPETLAELQRSLAARWSAGVLPWLQQRNERFRRPGTAAPRPSPFWDGHRDVQRYRT